MCREPINGTPLSSLYLVFFKILCSLVNFLVIDYCSQIYFYFSFVVSTHGIMVSAQSAVSSSAFPRTASRCMPSQYGVHTTTGVDAVSSDTFIVIWGNATAWTANRTRIIRCYNNLDTQPKQNNAFINYGWLIRSFLMLPDSVIYSWDCIGI
jgi:hypothetical protein